MRLSQKQPTWTTILKVSKPLKHSAQDIVGMVQTKMYPAERRRRWCITKDGFTSGPLVALMGAGQSAYT